jgi:hypothetical protein
VYIPLDYYRILGLPIQATPDQLRQAHRDRTVQLPRREYSEAAIASRKYLLDTAYALLADSPQRQAYDRNFLAKTYEAVPDPDLAGSDLTASLDANTPSIEIPDPHLVGALLILQELGEYELVLKLGRPFLTGGSASLKDGQFGDPNAVYADIVLTVAFACLELGREQWQQGQYENAAEALETGQQLLLREGFFAGVRGEIQSDLYKLRPYRVLELLALPERQISERRQGLGLLREMLQARGGIDGSGDDYSGLGMDDFLRFMQQLRGYLTVAEQQVLFEEETQRPSAVATYLAVYALLARGFAERQPALVRRAKLLLLRLSSRQDVHLEQSVCALLLGQTEEASRALELSQEYEPIAFIRKHSQGSPDLLPGLCLYAEHWLRDEVFPHFRDLSQQRVSLKEYFADPDVQIYLEELPNEPEVAPAAWSLAQAQERAYAYAASTGSRSPMPPAPMATVTTSRQSPRVGDMGARNGGRAMDGARESANFTDAPDLDTDALIELAKSRAMAGLAVPPGAAAENLAEGERTGDRPRAGGDIHRTRPIPDGPSPQVALRDSAGVAPRPRDGAGRSRRTKRAVWGFRLVRIGGILLGLILLGFGVSALLRSCQSTGAGNTARQEATPAVQPTDSVSPSIPVNPAAAATLDSAAAEQILKQWLEAKAAAMGPDYATLDLEKVLTEPKLSYWQTASVEAKRDNWYKKYKHDVKVISVQSNPDTPDQAEVVAEVSETEEFYTGGRLADSTPSDNLNLRYSLIRKDGVWHIADWR